MALLRFKNGGVGNIVASNSQKPGIYGKVHIHGSNGASVGVQTDGGSMFIAGMTSVLEPPVNDIWTVPGEEGMLARAGAGYGHLSSVDPATFYHQLQIQDFLQAILEDREPMITGREGRKTVEILTAIYRSQRDRKPVRFPLEAKPGSEQFDGRLVPIAQRPTCVSAHFRYNAGMDLFDHARKEQIEREAPLAARMRPRTLDEFVGQEHIVGPGRLLRRAIQADQLSSVIFYGPPGTGKTTLAMIIANTTRSHFETLNAVLAGVADIRRVTSEAQERRALYGQRTILFVDEVHRWNKAQQDALLPWVENGTVILIGATTENPYFSVNRPLVSRSRIFQFRSLTEEDLRAIARQALADPERGYGKLQVEIDDDALDHLVDVANGDARGVLNALELAVETTPPDERGRHRRRHGRGRGEHPAPGRALRQGWRLSLRHHQRLYQVAARLRPRRGALLAGQDGLCRRGSALYLSPDADLCR